MKSTKGQQKSFTFTSYFYLCNLHDIFFKKLGGSNEVHKDPLWFFSYILSRSCKLPHFNTKWLLRSPDRFAGCKHWLFTLKMWTALRNLSQLIFLFPNLRKIPLTSKSTVLFFNCIFNQNIQELTEAWNIYGKLRLQQVLTEETKTKRASEKIIWKLKTLHGSWLDSLCYRPLQTAMTCIKQL